MLRIFSSINGQVEQIEKPENGSWLCLSEPTDVAIAVEPMVNAGGAAVRVMPDGWTVRTQDGSLAAHYENTILITDGEAELLTLPEI